MASIRTGIELQDNFTNVMYSIIGSMNEAMSAAYDLQSTMNESVSTSPYDEIQADVQQTADNLNNVTDQQENFNQEVQDATDGMEGLESAVQKVVTAIGGMFAISKVVDFINDCTDAANVQNNAESQLAATLANMGGDEQDYDALVEKAAEIQQMGMYGDEALIGAAAEFATYMSDTSAIELMMDTLTDYAAGMSGGGEIDYESMVNYATNLGKITTGAYDAMTKKGFEFTDAQKAVIDGTATQAQYIEALGEDYVNMSDDMRSAQVIADIINESWSGLYATMSKTPEAQLISLRNSFGDLQEQVGNRLYPVLGNLYSVIEANMPLIESILMSAADGLNVIIEILALVIQAVADIGVFVQDNWSIIEPIIYGIIAALAVYLAYLAIVKGAELAAAAVKGALAVAEFIHVAALAAQTGATIAATAAQMGLNGAMYACPIVWIIMLIIAIIALIVMLCNWIAKATGAANSGIGIIVGALSVAVAFIGNIFIALINHTIDIFVVLWNFIAAFANFFGNVFTDPVGAIARLFFDLVDCILALLESLASAIDTLFGSDLASAVSGWRDDLGDWVDETFGQGEEIMATVNASDMHLDRFEYGAAWDAGVELGDGIAESLDNLSLDNLLGTTDIPDYETPVGEIFENSSMASNLDDIAGDTSGIKDSLDVTEEDLKYLRDIAEQEAVNRFTTAEIHVDMSGMQNTINNGMDLDGVVSGLTDAVNESIESMTEGVHE